MGAEGERDSILVREEQGFVAGCLWLLCCHCMHNAT